MRCVLLVRIFFFFNDTATTEIYTLSLHDALPIWRKTSPLNSGRRRRPGVFYCRRHRSEEHTSELQSRPHLVCRLLLEKKQPPPVTLTLSPCANIIWQRCYVDCASSSAVRRIPPPN